MSGKPVIAAQLYSFREFLESPEDIRKTMPRVRRIGYDSAQISGVGPIEPAELRRIMLDAGVAPIGAHVGLDEFRENLGKVVAKCRAWGVGYVAIPWLRREEYRNAAEWSALFAEFDRYAKTLRSEGLVLQYHNHSFEFEKLGIRGGRGGRTILDVLFARTRVLQAELDIGWVARGGCDPVAWVRKVSGRMDQVHLKDWGIRNDQPVWRAVGEGGIDWPAVLKACRAAGTRYFIVEQDSCPITGDPFRSLGISRRNLRKLGLG